MSPAAATAKMSAPVVDSVLELIGSTPLVEIVGIAAPATARLWGKCEHLNPGGSVKDRPCLAMLEEAERRGLLRRGDTVVEPTSGNTGIGLALVCAVKGYRLVLTMPASMSLERRALLQAYGAEIILTPPEEVMDGAIAMATRIASERGAFMPQQFSNPVNPEVHCRDTARELIEAMGNESIDVFVAAVGTGGTISGVGRHLKRHNPAVQIIAVEPASSPVLSGGRPGPSKLQGIGAGFVPDNFDRSVVDDICQVEDAAAFAMKARLAAKCGLLVGPTAAANVLVAATYAERLGTDRHVVTVLCDTGERYFSLDSYFGAPSLQ